MLLQIGVLGNGLLAKECVTSIESGFITTSQ